MASFDKYLKVSMDAVPENLPYLPAGHYFCQVSGWSVKERDYDKAAGGPKTPVVELTFKVTAADDDVDAAELPPGHVGMVSTIDYRLNDPSMSGQIILRRIAEKMMDLDVKGQDLDVVLDAMRGGDVKVWADQPRPDRNQDGVFYTNFKRVLPAHG